MKTFIRLSLIFSFLLQSLYANSLVFAQDNSQCEKKITKLVIGKTDFSLETNLITKWWSHIASYKEESLQRHYDQLLKTFDKKNLNKKDTEKERKNALEGIKYSLRDVFQFISDSITSYKLNYPSLKQQMENLNITPQELWKSIDQIPLEDFQSLFQDHREELIKILLPVFDKSFENISQEKRFERILFKMLHSQDIEKFSIKITEDIKDLSPSLIKRFGIYFDYYYNEVTNNDYVQISIALAQILAPFALFVAMVVHPYFIPKTDIDFLNKMTNLSLFIELMASGVLMVLMHEIVSNYDYLFISRLLYLIPIIVFIVLALITFDPKYENNLLIFSNTIEENLKIQQRYLELIKNDPSIKENKYTRKIFSSLEERIFSIEKEFQARRGSVQKSINEDYLLDLFLYLKLEDLKNESEKINDEIQTLEQ